MHAAAQQRSAAESIWRAFTFGVNDEMGGGRGRVGGGGEGEGEGEGVDDLKGGGACAAAGLLLLLLLLLQMLAYGRNVVAHSARLQQRCMNTQICMNTQRCM